VLFHLDLPAPNTELFQVFSAPLPEFSSPPVVYLIVKTFTFVLQTLDLSLSSSLAAPNLSSSPGQEPHPFSLLEPSEQAQACNFKRRPFFPKEKNTPSLGIPAAFGEQFG